MARIGAMDRRIRFERAQSTETGIEAEEIWSPVGGAVWAQKTDVSDGERWRAGEVAAHVTARFVVRASLARGITPADRLVCDGVVYDIVGIKEGPGRRERLEITAAARTDTEV